MEKQANNQDSLYVVNNVNNLSVPLDISRSETIVDNVKNILINPYNGISTSGNCSNSYHESNNVNNESNNNPCSNKRKDSCSNNNEVISKSSKLCDNSSKNNDNSSNPQRKTSKITQFFGIRKPHNDSHNNSPCSTSDNNSNTNNNSTNNQQNNNTNNHNNKDDTNNTQHINHKNYPVDYDQKFVNSERYNNSRLITTYFVPEKSSRNNNNKPPVVKISPSPDLQLIQSSVNTSHKASLVNKTVINKSKLKTFVKPTCLNSTQISTSTNFRHISEKFSFLPLAGTEIFPSLTCMSTDNKCSLIIKGSDLEEIKAHRSQGMTMQDVLSNPQLLVNYIEITTDENFTLTPPKGYCSLMLLAQTYLQYCADVTTIDREITHLNINLHRTDMSDWFSRMDQYNIKTVGFDLEDTIQLHGYKF